MGSKSSLRPLPPMVPASVSAPPEPPQPDSATNQPVDPDPAETGDGKGSEAAPPPQPDTNTTHQHLAQKSFAVRGKGYIPGDPIDVSDLADHKISQLLNQRWIRPNPNYKP